MKTMIKNDVFYSAGITAKVAKEPQERPTVSSLLSVSSDAKTIKNKKFGYLTGVQYMMPHKGSGITNLCKYASDGCIEACLNTAGRGSFDPNIAIARKKRTILFTYHKEYYFNRLIKEIESLVRKADREGLIPNIRLNGTSDIPWERVKVDGENNIFELFPNIEFYDYTKYPYIYRQDVFLKKNYHLTYSFSEKTVKEEMHSNLDNGRDVAVVFDICKRNYKSKCFTKCTCPLPKYATFDEIVYKSSDVHTVIDGDVHDLRFRDFKNNKNWQKGAIIGLRAKGRARKDYTGFVVRNNDIYKQQLGISYDYSWLITKSIERNTK